MSAPLAGKCPAAPPPQCPPADEAAGPHEEGDGSESEAEEEDGEWLLVSSPRAWPSSASAFGSGGDDRTPADAVAAAAAVVWAAIRGLLAGGGGCPSGPQYESYCCADFARVRAALPIPAAALDGPLRPLTSSGRSGAGLFQSNDSRLILKQIRPYEKDQLLRIAGDFVARLLASAPAPPSLLCPIFGCFRASVGPAPLYFVLLASLHPPGAAIRGLYDLKGSTANRNALDPEGAEPTLERHPSALKDNDLTAPLRLLTEESWWRLKASLEADSLFLRRHDIFDYSLLVTVVDAADPTNAAMAAWPGVRPWACARKQAAYCGIIDCLTPWAPAAFALPKVRRLAYVVRRTLQPGGSLMPPDLYQPRFLRNVLAKFSYPGQAALPAEGSTRSRPTGPRAPRSPPPAAAAPDPMRAEFRSLSSAEGSMLDSKSTSSFGSNPSDGKALGMCWDCFQAPAAVMCVPCDSPTCDACHGVRHAQCPSPGQRGRP